MKSHQKFLLLAGLVAGSLAASTMIPVTAYAANEAYCIAQSGPNGEASYVGNCNYASYDRCIAATVGSGSNCVANIDDNRDAMARLISVKGKRNFR